MGLPNGITVRGLFARSGNRCAFTDCYALLVEKNDVITGEVCHIKARSKGGPRYDPSQTDAERNAAANLILLCARDHKVVDDLPATYTVDLLLAMKKERELRGDIEITPEITRRAELLRQKLVIHVQGDLSVSTIHAQNVTIKSAGRTKSKTVLPGDVIGANSAQRSYLKYLIDRYQEFAKGQKDREFRFQVVYQSIKREFKAGWEWIPLLRFQEVVRFMQAKIDRTLIGRQRKKQGMASYEDFDSYSVKHR